MIGILLKKYNIFYIFIYEYYNYNNDFYFFYIKH